MEPKVCNYCGAVSTADGPRKCCTLGITADTSQYYKSARAALLAMPASSTQIGGQHYKDMAIQPAEFCQKNKLHFCESAVIKYVCRHGRKNGAQDIRKAIHFLHLLLEFEYPGHDSGTVSEMTMYQTAASETAIYPTLGHPIVYPALGLAGEAGEVAEKVKKMCRDNECNLTADRREAIKKELGDVLWYVSETARQAGVTLSEVAWANIKKLEERQEKNMLHGSGDDREQTDGGKQ